MSSRGNDDRGLTEDLKGRGKHLGAILLPFYHRGATWQDFGLFLEALFEGRLHTRQGAAPLFFPQKCRHNPGGKHFEALSNSVEDPGQYPMFHHVRYSRPCLSFGKGEVNKTPGFVVADTVTKACRFLESINKGEKIQDSIYDEESDCSPLEDVEDIELLMKPFDVEERRDNSSRQRPPRRASAAAADFPITLSDGEFDTTEASIRVGLGGQRSSTKVRAATLGYLWGFSRDPDRLRKETRRLRDEGDQHVLHLCGCGIPFFNPEGTLVPGCCEWSHLRLGTAEENGLHRSYHAVMGATMAEDYPALCDITHRGQAGYDLF